MDAALQRHGRGQGRAGSERALSCRRPRREEHPRQRDLGRTDQDAGVRRDRRLPLSPEVERDQFAVAPQRDHRRGRRQRAVSALGSVARRHRRGASRRRRLSRPRHEAAGCAGHFAGEGLTATPMPVPTIYYIRHGETSWNAEGRLQGAQDASLNELGRKQAAHAGNILADLFMRDGRDKSTLAFVSSPLGRAQSTMQLVRAELKLPPAAYGLDDRLREIGYGQWEGSTLAEMQAKDPELFAKRQLEKWTVAPPGGESYVSVQARMQSWYDSVREDMVAVAHGGTARALMVALGFETQLSAADLTIEQGAVYVFGTDGLDKYS